MFIGALGLQYFAEAPEEGDNITDSDDIVAKNAELDATQGRSEVGAQSTDAPTQNRVFGAVANIYANWRRSWSRLCFTFLLRCALRAMVSIEPVCLCFLIEATTAARTRGLWLRLADPLRQTSAFVGAIFRCNARSTLGARVFSSCLGLLCVCGRRLKPSFAQGSSFRFPFCCFLGLRSSRRQRSTHAPAIGACYSRSLCHRCAPPSGSACNVPSGSRRTRTRFSLAPRPIRASTLVRSIPRSLANERMCAATSRTRRFMRSHSRLASPLEFECASCECTFDRS